MFGIILNLISLLVQQNPFRIIFRIIFTESMEIFNNFWEHLGRFRRSCKALKSGRGVPNATSHHTQYYSVFNSPTQFRLPNGGNYNNKADVRGTKYPARKRRCRTKKEQAGLQADIQLEIDVSSDIINTKKPWLYGTVRTWKSLASLGTKTFRVKQFFDQHHRHIEPATCDTSMFEEVLRTLKYDCETEREFPEGTRCSTGKGSLYVL